MQHWPHVGMRLVKTSMAVFLCFVVYLLRGEQGIPFYSAIAAILCMQWEIKNSFSVAWNRVVGTLIGGFSGMGVLYLYWLFLWDKPAILWYLLVSLCIIPLIYLTVALHKGTAAYITCVVFLCITISHGMDVSPYRFAIDRMIDTGIGILVSLAVNAALPHHEPEHNHLP